MSRVPHMFCADCGYDIGGWKVADMHTGETWCPECGRLFDSDDPDTFARRPPLTWCEQWRWPLLILFGPPIVCLILWAIGLAG